METRCSVAPHRPEERGIALIFALLFTIIVSGICVTGTLFVRAHIQQNRTAWAAKSQALQVARSGLAEAHSWLRRQTSQPVLTFAPQLDTTATPQVLDTIDEEIGLVREFRITGKIYARYEVWKQWPTDPDPVRLAWRQQYQCEDISVPRGANSVGGIWRLRSVGYVYNRIDPALPFNQAPNNVIASQVATNEYRRVVIHLPGTAAVNIRQGSQAVINLNGRILGGTQAGLYYGSTPAPTAASLARITGSPPASPAVTPPPYDDSYEGVFGMSYAQLRALATLVVTTPAAFPSPMPQNGLVIIETGAPLNITSAKALLGNAIVIVKGSVTLADNNNANFNGMLYVEGNLTMRAPSLIKGSVLCTGTLTMQGVSDFATIQYDASVLNNLMAHVGNYTASNAPMLPRLDR